MSRTAAVIDRLEVHPNLGEILGVLAQLAHVTDADLPRLAAAWRNPPAVAAARDEALDPDSPLVCEVLAAFDALSALFEDDLRGEAPYLTVPRDVAVTALKAVRDAVAAAYARPALGGAQYAALIAPWRAVYPHDTVAEPDLGPAADQVKALLAALPQLASRCHDERGAALYEELVDRSFAGESERAEAATSAFSAAVLTSRRRIWALVRRSGAEGLGRPCPTCRTGAPTLLEQRELQRVLALCLDAACALLVQDALPTALTTLLTDPVAALIPAQRRPGGSS